MRYWLSAAIRRGLIEALAEDGFPNWRDRYPRRFAAALLKLASGWLPDPAPEKVIRGDSPRPY